MHITKFHQYMRSRPYNPTFNSNNVGTSLGMFSSVYYNPIDHRRASSNQKINQYQNYNPQGYQQGRKSRQMSNSFHQQERPNSNRNLIPNSSLPDKRQFNARQQNNGSPQINNQSSLIQKNNSYLSNYGTQSLGPQISDKQVYERQQKNYNIISIKPKEYNETIKKYPKYRLEDQDGNFYRKIQLQNQYRQFHLQQQKARNQERIRRQQGLRRSQNQQQRDYSNGKQQMAGMKTDFAYRELHPSIPFNN